MKDKEEKKVAKTEKPVEDKAPKPEKPEPVAKDKGLVKTVTCSTNVVIGHTAHTISAVGATIEEARAKVEEAKKKLLAAKAPARG